LKNSTPVNRGEHFHFRLSADVCVILRLLPRILKTFFAADARERTQTGEKKKVEFVEMALLFWFLEEAFLCGCRRPIGFFAFQKSELLSACAHRKNFIISWDVPSTICRTPRSLASCR
jgi:hypothetical protein